MGDVDEPTPHIPADTPSRSRPRPGDPSTSASAPRADAASSGDPLPGRLDAYFTDLDSHDMPESLRRATAADVRLRPAGWRAWWPALGSGTRSGPARGLVALGAAAAVVVAVIALVAVRPSDDALQVGGPVAGTTAPTTAIPTPRPGTAAPGTTVPVPETAIDPAGDPTTTTVDAVPTVVPTVTPGPTVPSTMAPPFVTTTAPPPTSPNGCGAALFCDDFSQDPTGTRVPTGWQVDSGAWYVAGTTLPHFAKSDAAADVESRLSTGSATWTDYEVAAVTRYQGTPTWVGVAARYQDASNYAFCKIDIPGNRLVVGTLVGGVATARTTPYPATANTDRTLRLSVSGGSATCRVEGGPTVALDGVPWASGRIALLSQGPAGLTGVVVTAA